MELSNYVLFLLLSHPTTYFSQIFYLFFAVGQWCKGRWGGHDWGKFWCKLWNFLQTKSHIPLYKTLKSEWTPWSSLFLLLKSRITVLLSVIIQSLMEVISLKNTKSEDESEKHRKQYSEWGSKVHSELTGIWNLWSIWNLNSALFCAVSKRGGCKRDILYPQLLTVYLRQQTETWK